MYSFTLWCLSVCLCCVSVYSQLVCVYLFACLYVCGQLRIRGVMCVHMGCVGVFVLHIQS